MTESEVSRPALAVLGMHRSGTSAVARLLTSIGGSAGPPWELMAAKPDNPHGFYERLDVFALHEELLEACGQRWDTVGNLPLETLSIEELDAGARRFSAAVGSITADDGFTFVKDPRLAWFLDRWRSVWQPTAVLVVVRHPVAVASSLAARNGMSTMHSLALWESHVLQALAVSADVPRLVVSFENLCSEPDLETARIAGFLERRGVTTTGAVGAGTLDSIDRSVVHHEVGEAVRIEWPWLAELWAELRDAACSDEAWSGAARRLSTTATQTLGSVREVLRHQDRLAEQETFYQGAIATEQRRYEELFLRRNTEVEALRKSLQELGTASVQPAGPRYEEHVRELELARAQVSELRQSHEDELCELRGGSERLEEELNALREEQEQRRHELEELAASKAASEANLTDAERQLAESEKALGEEQQRRSDADRDRRRAAEKYALLESSVEAERARRQVSELETEQLAARCREMEWVLERYEKSRSVRWSKAINRALRRL